MRKPLAERLAAFTIFDPATGCLNWTGGTNAKGYGRMTTVDGTKLPHRLAYEIAFGPIPDGLVIDHLCRNPSCCQPSHLEAVTLAENTRRGNSGLKDRVKTHCPKGHAYDAENTYRAPNGDRYCRTCIRARGPKMGDARLRDNARRRASKAQAVLDRGGVPRRKRADSGRTAQAPKTDSQSHSAPRSYGASANGGE